MGLFAIIVVVYIALLVLVKPEPESLKSKPLTYFENFKKIWASLSVGINLLIVFLVVSNFKFDQIDEQLFVLFALNNQWEALALWPMQAISHLLIHINFVHVLTNLSGIGLASVYERRVGARRYLMVLAVACISSIPSIFFYTTPIGVCGISGGVFGLAAAYFTDHKELNTKEWIYAILLFAFLMVAFAVQNKYQHHPRLDLDFQVDHLGHIFGAIGAIVYCRLRPKFEEVT